MTQPNGGVAADVVGRVRGEFLDLPGLRLTEPQARRLWSLEPETCSMVLDALVRASFLSRTQDGAYVRLDQRAGVRKSPLVRSTAA